VEFVAPMPLSIPKVEAHTSNEFAMSNYCRFAQGVLFSPVEGFDVDFDLVVEQGDGSQSDGLCKRFVLYANSALWHQLMTAEDLQPELLRRSLRLKKFDFVVCDNANIHTLTDSYQAQEYGQALDLKRVVLARQPKPFFFS